MNRQELARLIDHTNLKPEATQSDIARLCQEAIEYHFYSVCINPCWVAAAASLLRDQPVKVCAVAGFPLGANTTATKAGEAEAIVRDGGTEVDMVLNVGLLKEGDRKQVERDISIVRSAIGAPITLKVIIEACLLTSKEKEEAAKLVISAGADFVKTSTGFNPGGGATVDDVKLLRRAVGGRIKIKAAGGIRTLSTAIQMIEAGADRLGASSSVAIVQALPA